VEANTTENDAHRRIDFSIIKLIVVLAMAGLFGWCMVHLYAHFHHSEEATNRAELLLTLPPWWMCTVAAQMWMRTLQRLRVAAAAVMVHHLHQTLVIRKYRAATVTVSVSNVLPHAPFLSPPVPVDHGVQALAGYITIVTKKKPWRDSDVPRPNNPSD
jgi:hypothetical protein